MMDVLTIIAMYPFQQVVWEQQQPKGKREGPKTKRYNRLVIQKTTTRTRTTRTTPSCVVMLLLLLGSSILVAAIAADDNENSSINTTCRNFHAATQQCQDGPTTNYATSSSTTSVLYEQRLHYMIHNQNNGKPVAPPPQQQPHVNNSNNKRKPQEQPNVHQNHREQQSQQQSQQRQRLTPSDLPVRPKVFDNFKNGTTTVRVTPIPSFGQTKTKTNNYNTNNYNTNTNQNNNQKYPVDITVRSGEILQQGTTAQAAAPSSKVAYLPQLIPRTVIRQILILLRGHDNATLAQGYTSVPLDTEPDSVDGMTSQEIFLDNDALRRGQSSKGGGGDAGPNAMFAENMAERAGLRHQLNTLLRPYQEQLTAFLATWFDECRDVSAPHRTCTPCYSLVRRYRSGERQSHAPHNDAHSLVTVVVSLSDYETEYIGGLYVSSKTSERHYLKLNRGDAVAHQGDLHHGVNVLDTTSDGKTKSERWSWIMWYRDSTTCEDYSKDWYTECSNQGSPICMYLRANAEHTSQGHVYWNTMASQAGHAQASVKLGYAYLKALSSELPFDMDLAISMFQKAIDSSNEPDGHYGLATVYLAQAKLQAHAAAVANTLVLEAIDHLEEAAKCGHVFAMFNLGIVHLYGYGHTEGHGRNPKLAAEWFSTSKLPEGLYARSLYEASVGHSQRAKMYQHQAHLMGYGTPWRQHARKRTGSGGSSGANLNLQWPPVDPTGEIPDEW